MSGYCLECGNDICVCDELEEEARKQPDVVFICQRKKIEELQEQNKILREALEFYATEKDWDFYCGCCADGSTKLEKDHGKLAREALAKVRDR